MVSLDNTIVAVANPAIGRSLHAGLGGLQWLANAYLLALAVGVIPGGKLGDRFGRKRMFIVGTAGFTAASAACGLAASLGQLVAFRAAQGIFGALLLPQTLAILRATFPLERLAEVVGIWTGASAVAAAAGPLVGGVLVEQFSWHAVFFVNVPIGVLSLAVGAWVVAESRDTTSGPAFDLPGLVLLAAGLSAFVWGLIRTEDQGWLLDGALPFLLLAAALLVAFVRREARTAAPLVPLDLFRSRELSAGVVLAVCGQLCQFGVVFFVTLFLQRVQGLSPAQAGVRMLALTATEIVSGPLGGRLTDRIGPRRPLTASFVVMAASLAVLSQLRAGSGYLLIGVPLIGVGVTIGIMGSAASACVVGNASRDRAGVASGVQVTAFQLGAVLGSSALGSVVAARVSAVLQAHMVAAGVPASVLSNLHGATRAVSQGLVPTAGATPAVNADITRAAFSAFTSGLDLAFAVAAGLAVLCAVLAATATGRGARFEDAGGSEAALRTPETALPGPAATEAPA